MKIVALVDYLVNQLRALDLLRQHLRIHASCLQVELRSAERFHYAAVDELIRRQTVQVLADPAVRDQDVAAYQGEVNIVGWVTAGYGHDWVQLLRGAADVLRVVALDYFCTGSDVLFHLLLRNRDVLHCEVVLRVRLRQDLLAVCHRLLELVVRQLAVQLHVFRELDDADRDSALLLKRLHHIKGCLVYLENFASCNRRFL